MVSILYVADAAIHHVGPFNNRDEAMKVAKKLHCDEFNANHQHVYLINSELTLIELTASDLES